MAPAPSSATTVVLLKDLAPIMLDEIVGAVLAALPDVALHRDELPDGVTADLVVEGASLADQTQPPVLRVAPDGSTVCTVPGGELTEPLLILAVNASRKTVTRSWLDSLLVACRRIDALLDRATVIAERVYGDHGTFEDWRSAVAASRLVGGGTPLVSPLAVSSASVDAFTDALASSRFLDAKGERDHPFTRLVMDHGLDGRQIDILLLCFVHELDARYGRRFAYLQQDLDQPLPTVDLLAALLALDAAERIDIHRELLSGPLTQLGLVATRPRGSGPLRSQPLVLDPSVTRMLLGDEAPTTDEVVLDPLDTPRVTEIYRAPSAGITAADTVASGGRIHLAGGNGAARRSAALDVALAQGRRLLCVDYADLADEPTVRGQRLRRELLRLGALALVDGVPDTGDEWQAVLGPLGPPVISGGSGVARPTGLTDTDQRTNVTVVPPSLADRAPVWAAASAWTGVTVEPGVDSLVDRYGVTVDRAAAALTAASRAEGSDAVPIGSVTTALSEATVDNAGGLLSSGAARVGLDQLVVDGETAADLRHACDRILHRDRVISGHGWDERSPRLTGTYLLFAGPPGTGKTMAAEAIGHELGLPVQYLEISSLLSRWVGDFEAAVDKVFAAAEASGGILVANEADAILGPRTEVDDAQSKYANAGTSHLLSRLEQFTGHVVFTSNLIGANNIDPAFHRRLTATVRFRPPDETLRRRLWRSVWPGRTRDGRSVIHTVDGVAIDDADLLDELARVHEISGGSIANIARTASFLAAAATGPAVGGGTNEPVRVDISAGQLRNAVRIELNKVGDFRSMMRGRAAS